ncbi:MAG: phosphatase PAP2 family protein [Marmoricola sp.]
MADLKTRRTVPQQRRGTGTGQAPAAPQSRARGLLELATSIPGLAAAFVVFTLLAMSPLEPLDRALDQHWVSGNAPGLMAFLNDGLDRLAGQQVNLTVLAVVAITLAWRRLSWRPILLAIMAEAGFYSTGLLKILFARPAPYIGGGHDPDFFDGGLLTMGRDGISYPSGHAAEAVLVYGAVVYLLTTYGHLSSRAVRAVRWAYAAVVVNAVAVAFLLGYHWVTDLVGGLLFGALLLQVVVHLDRGWRRAHRERVTDSAS